MTKRLQRRSAELKREIAYRDGGCIFCQTDYYPPYIPSDVALHRRGRNYVLMCNWHLRMWAEDWFGRREEMNLLIDRHLGGKGVKWGQSRKRHASNAKRLFSA